MSIHILPINDLKEHEELSTCACNPKMLTENGEMIFVHNSYDGRELFEEINEYLNNKEMTTEKQKLDAALDVVADSVLHGWTIESKIKYVTQILPDHYEVKESKQKGNVHCKSVLMKMTKKGGVTLWIH
jgi:ascorbate-specific PTS system EIIC-type component UlaA